VWLHTPGGEYIIQFLTLHNLENNVYSKCHCASRFAGFPNPGQNPNPFGNSPFGGQSPQMPIGGTNGNPFPFGGNNQPGGFNPQGPGGQFAVVSFT